YVLWVLYVLAPVLVHKLSCLRRGAGSRDPRRSCRSTSGSSRRGRRRPGGAVGDAGGRIRRTRRETGDESTQDQQGQHHELTHVSDLQRVVVGVYLPRTETLRHGDPPHAAPCRCSQSRLPHTLPAMPFRPRRPLFPPVSWASPEGVVAVGGRPDPET